MSQHAVDAIANTQEVLFRLEMDIRGAALHRVGQQGVDQAHHRLAVFVGSCRQALKIDFTGFDFVQDAVDRELIAEILVDGARDFRFARQQRHHLERLVGGGQQVGTQLVEGNHIVRVGHGDGKTAARAIQFQRKQHVALGEFRRQGLDGRRVDDDVRKVDAGGAKIFGQGIAQRRFGDKTQVLQCLAQRLIGALLLLEGDAQLVFRQNAALDQNPAQRFGRRRRAADRRLDGRGGHLVLIAN